MSVNMMRISWLGLMLLAGTVGAANLTWDTATGDGATITDGSGNWVTGSGNWNTGSGDTTWTDGSDAIIGGGTLGAAGTITITSGVSANSLTFNNPNGGGAYTISGGTLTLTGSAAITNNANSTINSLIAGSAGLSKAGTGMLTLSRDNSLTGNTIVNSGTLDIAPGGVLHCSTYTVASGATLLLSAILDNPIGGGYTLLLSGNMNSTGGAANTLGTIILTNGTMSGVSAIDDYGTYYVNASGATITANGNNNIINAANFGMGGGTLTLVTPIVTDSLSISSVIGTSPAKGGGLYKDGNGTLTLSGANIYIGNTTVNSGTLDLAPGGVLRSPTFTVASGATLKLSATVDSPLGTGYTLLLSGNMNSTGGAAVTLGTVTLNNGTMSGVSATDDYGTYCVSGSGATITANGNNNIINAANIGMSGLLTLATPNATDSLSISAAIGTSTVQSGGLTKTGNGTLILSGANTLTGAITLNAGTLVLSGVGGSLSSCNSLALGSGVTLKLDNTTASNNTDRLKDTATVTLNGGTFLMSNDGGASNFSETVGALTVAAGTSTIATSQAQAGYSNTLTFASLTYTGGFVDFSGPGLGDDARNRIMFTTPPTLVNGIIGTWATYGGSTYATYDPVLGVVPYVASYLDIAARGPSSTIADGSTTDVRINSPGTSGNIELGATTTTISSLLQNTTTPATVNTADKVFRTSGITIRSGMEALTIGAAANDGILTVQTGGGALTLVNNSTTALTINACIMNNASASALSTIGNVVLNGTNSYTGTTTISGGSLTFGSAAPQTISNVIGGDGRVVATGGGMLTLGTANTYTGGTTIDSGATVVAPVAGSLGTAASGPLVVNGTLNLAVNSNLIYTFGGAVSGNGVINASNSSDWFYLGGTTWTAFAGTINITAGRLVPPSTGLPSTTTVNVDGTGQLFPQGGTFLATLNLNAGSGFDKYGLFRLSNSSTWSGPIRLYTNATIGFNSGIISGPIGDNGAQYGIIFTSPDGGALYLSGTNTYSGDTRLESHWLYIDNALSLQNSTLDMNVTDGGLPSFTQNSTLGGLKGSRNLDMGTRTLSIGNNNQTNIYSGILANGALVKIGSGTLTLSGPNTYSGGTTVSNGTLLVNGSIAGSVTIAPGGTFGGTGTVAGAVSNYGTISPASTTTNGTLTVSSMTMAENSTYVWNMDATTNDVIVVNGSLTLPSVATVTVSRATGRLPNNRVLFTGFTSVNTSNLSGWVINGALPNTRARVVGNQVLMLPPGTLISFH